MRSQRQGAIDGGEINQNLGRARGGALNLFKPTESDKEALIKKLNKGFTVTFLMNSGASTVKLDDLDSQPYTEKLDAFLDVDTSTHNNFRLFWEA